MRSKLKVVSEISVHNIYKSYQNYRQLAKAKRISEDYLSKNSSSKLHIGCGGNVIPGWLNSDLQPQFDNVIFLDASKRFPFPNESFGYIFSEHLFEHLNIAQQCNMLRESFRVLKPMGKIRVATPDFDFIIGLYNNRSEKLQKYKSWSAKTYMTEFSETYGKSLEEDVFIINNYFHNWGHQFIHTAASLKYILLKTGFKLIERKDVGKSADPLLIDLEKHGEVIPEEYNKMETMIFEASK